MAAAQSTSLLFGKSMKGAADTERTDYRKPGRRRRGESHMNFAVFGPVRNSLFTIGGKWGKVVRNRFPTPPFPTLYAGIFTGKAW